MFEQVAVESSVVGEPIGDSPTGGTFAWETFARAHGRAVDRCVVRAMVRAGWVPRADEVQELAQEVYCRLLERGDAGGVTGRPPAQLWCYLQRVAYSVVVDQLRARHARKRGGWPPRTGTDNERRGLDDGLAPGPSPEERLLVRERAREVRRRVRQAFPGPLGERNLRVLELSAVEGLTAVEIADRLAGELTASSVHTVLHRLRRLLLQGDGAAAVAAAG